MLHVQAGRETGRNGGMEGTGMTRKANGSILLDFNANISRNN
jgi:hypothetical protein